MTIAMTLSPRTFVLDPATLVAVKAQIDAGAKRAALEQLVADANLALTQGPFSVIDKPVVPPSGDKHDYLSRARYWWRNPNTPDGLPYVDCDGEVNPEIWTIPDHRNFDILMEAVAILGLAFFFTGDNRYASHATHLSRVWFLNPGTRMNPNLNFAQGIRGINDGRGIGIIETRELATLIDGIGLLAGSSEWTAADQRGIVSWCEQFLDWLLNSKNGREEAASQNNHGTFYDAQTAALALFVDKPNLAHTIIENGIHQRIPAQFEPDGKQPLELARTLSWHYSIFNLQAWFRLASLGERVGIDVWNYQTPDGKCLRAALDFLLPFANGAEWNYQQIAPREYAVLFALLCHAACKYNDAHYTEVALRLPGVNAFTHRINLLLE